SRRASRPHSSLCARVWPSSTSINRSRRSTCASGRRRRRSGRAMRRPPGTVRISEGEATMGLVKMPVVTPDTEPEEQGRPNDRHARPEEVRRLEAMLCAASEPLSEKELAERLPQGVDVHASLVRLQQEYAARGVNLCAVAGKWSFRTASDLSWLLSKETVETR